MGLRELHRRRFLIETIPVVPENLFIGGVASEILTPADLAAKLTILESDISIFNIVGNDIEARIELDYAPVFQAFFNNTNLTYWKSTGGKLTATGGQSFSGSSLQFFEDEDVPELSNSFVSTLNLRRLNINNVTHTSVANAINSSSLLRLDLPSLSNAISGSFQFSLARVFYLGNPSISLGSDALNNNVFDQIFTGAKIYVDQSLATNNAGSPDGDLTYAITQGAEVIYITDRTAPSKITGISTGTAYATNIELNFTTPASVNLLKSYQVFVDGEYNGEYDAGKQVYASGLAPNTLSGAITIVAVDEFYNRSTPSNPFYASTTTVANSPMLKTGLVSVHNFSDLTGNTAYDSYGVNNGTSYNVAKNLKGSIGLTYLLHENNSHCIIPHSADHNFSSGGVDVPFTICFDVVFLKNQNSFLVGKTNGSVRVWELMLESGNIKFRQFSNGSGTVRREVSYPFTPVLGQKYSIVAQSDASGLTGMELYFNNVKVGTGSNFGTYVAMKADNTENIYIGKYPTLTTFTLAGSVSNLKIHKNYAFSATDRNNNYNNGNGITL